MILPDLTSTDTAAIAAVGSMVVPPVVSLLKQEKWSAQVKQLIAAVLSAVVALAGLALAGASFSASNIVSLLALIFMGSQVVYGAYFRGSAVEVKLSTIGTKKPAPAPAPAAS